MCSEILSKILSAISSSLPLTVCLRIWLITGSSAISNQLEAEFIMVKAIKSICKLSLHLRVYRPMRSMHKHSQRLLMMVLGRVRLLLIWQDLQDFVIDQMVVRIPFQYITVLIVSSRCVCPVCFR
jgi:hypothetical protein